MCWCSSDNAAKWKEVELTQSRVPPQARLREKQLRTQEEDNITVAETLAVCIEILRRLRRNWRKTALFCCGLQAPASSDQDKLTRHSPGGLTEA